MQKANLIIIISGSIASIKIPFLIKSLKNLGIGVQCVLTEAAKKMITKEVIESVSDNYVIDSLEHMKHISLSRKADLIVVAPATANIIAKIAHGIADDIATTTILASNKKIIIVPAMNKEMWNNPATQDNLSILKLRNFIIIPPDIGKLACDEYGIGRMKEVDEILDFIIDLLTSKNKSLTGYKAVITTGGTREYIDEVRYISNNSSGMQGNLIAESLCVLGAEVILISSSTLFPSQNNIKIIKVTSADDMLKSTIESMPADIFISAAAVCDFKPCVFQNGKIKKKDFNTSINIVANPDILQIVSCAQMNKNNKTNLTSFTRPRLVIGFSMEATNMIENAKQKLISKNCDWMFANNIESANSENTHLFLINNNLTKDLGTISKKEASKKIAEFISDFFIKPDFITDT